MTMKKRIKELESTLAGLNNDARYWDLRRTYGDYSREVLRHLETCVVTADEWSRRHTETRAHGAWDRRSRG